MMAQAQAEAARIARSQQQHAEQQHAVSEGPEQNAVIQFLIAAHDGDTQTVRRILRESDGAAKDWQNEEGGTALMVAAGKGLLEMASVLVKAGAALDLQKADGSSALMEAAVEGKTEVISLFVEAGAALDLRSQDGATALSLLAARCTVELGFWAAGVDRSALEVRDRSALEVQELRTWTGCRIVEVPVPVPPSHPLVSLARVFGSSVQLYGVIFPNSSDHTHMSGSPHVAHGVYRLTWLCS